MPSLLIIRIACYTGFFDSKDVAHHQVLKPATLSGTLLEKSVLL